MDIAQYATELADVADCEKALAEMLEEDIDHVVAMTQHFVNAVPADTPAHIVLGAAMQVIFNVCSTLGQGDHKVAVTYGRATATLIASTIESNNVIKMGVNQ